MVPLLACLGAIIHSQRPQCVLKFPCTDYSLHCPMFSKHLDSVTPKKDRWQSFKDLNNIVTPISGRKLKVKQTSNLSEKVKVVMMELDRKQLSMEEVRQSIEERQKKISDTIEKRAAKNAHIAQSNLKKSKMNFFFF